MSEDDLLVRYLRAVLQDRGASVPPPVGLYERIRQAHRRRRNRAALAAAAGALALLAAVPVVVHALPGGRPASDRSVAGQPAPDPPDPPVGDAVARGSLAGDAAVLAAALAAARRGYLRNAGDTVSVVYAGEAAGYAVAVVIGWTHAAGWTPVAVARAPGAAAFRDLPMDPQQRHFERVGGVESERLVASTAADHGHWFAIILQPPGSAVKTWVDTAPRIDCTVTAPVPTAVPTLDGTALIAYTGTGHVRVGVTPPATGATPPVPQPYLLRPLDADTGTLRWSPRSPTPARPASTARSSASGSCVGIGPRAS
jgi:hypothetical protein